MKKAILGVKVGMTQVFTPDGIMIPVTVLNAGPCAVTQKKTVEKDGYSAVQVAFGEKREKLFNKPLAGHYKKAGVKPCRYLRELRLEDADKMEVGQEIKADVFKAGDKVDVVGTSKGHGFTGVIKRWNNQRVGSMTHGTGPIHRSVGSMSAGTDPSRVFKNKHMPGHWGCEQVTVQNLEVVRVDEARNLLLIKGGIPGAKGSLVIVKDSIKA